MTNLNPGRLKIYPDFFFRINLNCNATFSEKAHLIKKQGFQIGNAINQFGLFL